MITSMAAVTMCAMIAIVIFNVITHIFNPNITFVLFFFYLMCFICLRTFFVVIFSKAKLKRKKTKNEKKNEIQQSPHAQRHTNAKKNIAKKKHTHTHTHTHTHLSGILTLQLS